MSHPLDVELLSLARGAVSSECRDSAEAHLKECLLCRIRLQRLVSAQLPKLSEASAREPAGLAIPQAIVSLLRDPPTRGEPEPDELWLAGSDERLLLWIRAVRGGIVLCHPVTLDVEMADAETLVISDDVSPLGIRLALWTALTGDVQVSALSVRVGKLSIRAEVDALQSRGDAAATLSLETGLAITEGTDERIEYRQLLADQLAELSALIEEDGDVEQDHVHSSGEGTRQTADLYGLLATDLSFRRGSTCRVVRVDDVALSSLASEVGWTIVALVTELTCAILVVAGRDGELLSEAPRAAAIAKEMIHLGSATSLAIASPVEPHDTLVFEPSHLVRAIEVPDGEFAGVTPRHDSLPITDALFKYLDAVAMPMELEAPDPSPQIRVDLEGLIGEEVRVAIRAKREARTPIAPKKRAQQSLDESDAEMLAMAIQRAIAGDSLSSGLKRIAARS